MRIPHLQFESRLGPWLILLLAFVLRVYRLGDQNVWWDEGLTVWSARKSLADMTLWTAGDVHPPFYFWLVWPWIRLVGESEFAVRFLTVAISILSVALLYALGVRLANRPVAFLGMLLLATSRFHIWWAQEMRMYSLAALAGLASLYFAVRLMQDRTWRFWLAYVLSTAAALYTIYLAGLFLIVENIFFLFALFTYSAYERRRAIIFWFTSQLAVVVLFLPWLALALPRMQSWSVTEPASPFFVYHLWATLLATGISTYLENHTLLVVIFALIVLAGLALVARTDRRAALLFGLLLVVPPTVIFFLTLPGRPFYTPRVEARYFLPFAPPFFLFLGWGLILLLRKQRTAGILATLFTAALFAWSLPQHYAGRWLRDEFKTMARVIWAYGQPDDAVLLVSGNRFPVFLYEYDQPRAPATRPPVYLLPKNFEIFTSDNISRELEPFASQPQRLWLAWVEGPMQDLQRLVEPWLAGRYARPLSFAFAHNALHLFTFDGQEPAVTNLPPYRIDQQLAPGLIFVGYDLATREFRPGDVVRLGVHLNSEVAGKVIVALVDESNLILESQTLEVRPSPGVVRKQAELLITRSAPSSRYRLVVMGPEQKGTPLVEVLIAGTPSSFYRGEIPVNARLGESIHLVGYQLRVPNTGLVGLLFGGDQPLARPFRPGEEFLLDLFWKTDAPLDERYTVFTHLVGEAFNPATGGPVWAQHDSEPLEGGYPTSQWLSGSIVRDRHILRLDPTAPAGEYLLEVGMYLPQSGERLPVQGDGGDLESRRIILTAIEVQ